MWYSQRMLADEIRARMKAAMKARNTIEKEVLRVALGEISMEEGRGKTMDDAAVQTILRKLVKSNRETIKMVESADEKDVLAKENAVLESMLPKMLDADGVLAALADVVDEIKACGNAGQATGIAMRHLKGKGAQVDGRTVSAAVQSLRTD